MRLDEIGMAYMPSKIQHNYLPNMERHINQFRESENVFSKLGFKPIGRLRCGETFSQMLQ
jgi:hypothetical protein